MRPRSGKVTPGELAAYARTAGWAKAEPYGDSADVWLGESLPEIVLPRTHLLGDYASVVSRLIGIFSEESGKDEIATLKDLLEADYDVIRVRAMEGATDGSVALDTGVEMVSQAREMPSGCRLRHRGTSAVGVPHTSQQEGRRPHGACSAGTDGTMGVS